MGEVDDVGRESRATGRGGERQRAARLLDSTGLSAEDPLRAVVSRRVPALAEAVDANVGAGMRRVDEVSASDVDPDVVQPVEEDEITGLKLVLRNRHGGGVVPLSDGVVRQRDAELAEHVLDETRAVEAARSRPGPDVWDTEVLRRHRDDAAVAAGGGAESQGARDERRVARLLLQPAESSVGGVQTLLEPTCARLRRVSAHLEEDGALVNVRDACADWLKMKASCSQVAHDLVDSPPTGIPRDEVEQAQGLLEWL